MLPKTQQEALKSKSRVRIRIIHRCILTSATTDLFVSVNERRLEENLAAYLRDVPPDYQTLRPEVNFFFRFLPFHWKEHSFLPINPNFFDLKLSQKNSSLDRLFSPSKS
jgi:hypothetical protein